MRIALITDGIHPYVLGGMQMHSFYLAKYFAKNKIHVDLFHPVIDIKADRFLNCFAVEEQKYIHPLFVPMPKLMYFPGHYIYESYNYSKNVYEKYRENSAVDFIYAQGFTAWELINQKKKGNSLIAPIGVNFHGLNMFQPSFGLNNKLNNLLFAPPVKYNLKHADCVFSLGKNLSDLIRKNVRRANIIIEIPVGINDSWLINESEVKNTGQVSFVFVGRYDKVKGIDLLNNAIENLIKKNKCFSFNFIGPFPFDSRLDHSNVKYHGEIKDALILKDIIKQNDVIVSSSYSEGMPTVIIEAMACGLAVIATNVGAVNELVDEKNGYLIPAGSTPHLEKSMEKFIQMEAEQLLRMKKESLARVNAKFLWEKIIVKTIHEIEKIID